MVHYALAIAHKEFGNHFFYQNIFIMSSLPRMCSLESRRASEMAMLISKFGGAPVSAPSMKEVPLDENQPAIEAITQLVQGNVDALVLMTGVGTNAMLEIAESANVKESLLKRMAEIPLLIRGPKPAAVLKKLQLQWTVKAPEPNTWQDLLNAIDASDVTIDGTTIAVQEYGIPNPEFYAGLEARGATVMPMPVYRWALPDDLAPLQDAIGKIIAGEVEAVLFTSAQQARHLLMIADQMAVKPDLLNALHNTLVSSIGPTCTETLQAEGLPIHFEANPPKMGPLVRGTMDKLAEE